MSAATETRTAPGRRRSALAWLTFTEFRLFMREPLVVFWGIALPLLLLIIFGNIPAFKKSPAGYEGLTVLDAFIPILIMLTLAMLSFFSLPLVLAGYREQRVLRRLQTTPAGPWRVLAAQLLLNVGSAAVMIAAILLIGRGLGAPFPLALGKWIVVALLTTTGTLAIGLLIAAVAPTARMAGALGQVLFYPLMFFAGLYFPIPAMPAVLQHISHATPLGAAWESFQQAALGHWPPALAMGTIAGYAVVCGVAAAKMFRWE